MALSLGCFALSPRARAICQEGCLTNENTVLGDGALVNSSGARNTAIGWEALLSNSDGSNNTATGVETLLFNTTGNSNTATGAGALVGNDTGNENTATGVDALYYNTTGNDNTATGVNALFGNDIGHSNTATGVSALESNTTGNQNTATGFNALLNNTTGINNTATGTSALQSNTTGSNNIAVGANAGTTLTSGSNNIDIGNAGRAGEAKTIRIGSGGIQTKTFVAGIRGVTTQNANAIPVLIDSAGQLGTVSSSRRFKQEIKPMDQSSEAILGLKPVTFHYKSDSQGTPQFGLIAEEVAEVNPDLVVRDEQGKPYTVRYEAVNAMLLNEFLKEHRKVEEQGAIIAKQQKQIEALTAGLQKVSAQVEMIGPVPQTVVDNY